MKRIAILTALALLLLLAAPVLANPGAAYLLNWFTPLTGSGAQAGSSHYSTNLTVGQAATGAQVGTAQRVGLGFWYGRVVENRVFLSNIRK
jgi:hypothetical protein